MPCHTIHTIWLYNFFENRIDTIFFRRRQSSICEKKKCGIIIILVICAIWNSEYTQFSIEVSSFSFDQFFYVSLSRSLGVSQWADCLRSVYRLSTCIWRSTRRIENISIFHTTHTAKWRRETIELKKTGTHMVSMHTQSSPHIAISFFEAAIVVCIAQTVKMVWYTIYRAEKNARYVHIFFLLFV